MAIDKSERVDFVEYMTVYPSLTEGQYVFLMVAITDKKNRVLIYAPMVKVGPHSIEAIDQNDYEGDWRRPLSEICRRKYCKFMAEFFSINSTDNSEEFFKVLVLDGNTKPKIRREEIERLFGCKIDG